MNKKDPTPRVISAWKKIAAVFLGLILSLALLEAGLRLGGFVLSSMQEYGNLQSIKQKGTYRILCLGESTTQRQYPHLLEQVLNERNIGVRFSVIDKGQTDTNTVFILTRVESYLAEYHPDMVVAMMGSNDIHIMYYQDIAESDTWLFRHCRTYKFGKILCMQLLKKLLKKDIYGFNGSNSDKNENPSNKMPAVNVRGSDSESEKGSPESNRRLSGDEKFLRKGSGLNLPGTPRPVSARVSTPDADYVETGRWLCRRQGKLIEAEASFKKALELNPENDNAYVELGRLYRFQDKLSQAENVLKKAIELNPDNDEAYVELGWVYNDQGKVSQVEDLFKKAIELDPENDFNQARIGGGFIKITTNYPKPKTPTRKPSSLILQMNLLYLN